MQGFAGDVAGRRPGQERDRTRDIGRLAQTTECDLIDQAALGFLGHGPGHIGIDETRRDHVDGNAGQANYAAAKAGIIAFSKSLAKEIGSRGVTVNVVAPGFIDTDMTKALPEEARAALIGDIALERLGSPEDIAHAVAFLASPAANYITGETLHVNGGMYMP